MADNIKVLAGSILLKTTEYDWDVFRMQLFDDWKVEITEEAEEDSFIFKINDVTIACSLNRAVKEGAVEGAANNYEWEGAVQAVESHCAYLDMGVLDCPNPLQRHILFSMVASSMMKQDNVIGIYQYPVVRRAGNYIETSEMMNREEFPIINWVFIGIYKTKEGLLSAYTYGMEDFDKEEIEIINSKADVLSLYQFLYKLVDYVIMHNDVLSDGQCIGFSKNKTYDISRSEGVVLQGTTIKVAF